MQRVATKWQPNGNTGKVSIGKDSIGEVRVVEVSEMVDTDVDNFVDNSTFEYVGGTLGKGVVLLTEAQKDSLLEILGLDGFNHYIDKLSSFIIDKKAKVGNHYNTILKWAKEDKMISLPE